MPLLLTSRIRLRPWEASDAIPFARLNADAEVMRYFPAPLSRDESDALLNEFKRRFDSQGFGFWAAEFRENADFLGFIGLNIPSFETHFTPCVEIGWRLRREYWNQGLATEGALACLDFAFQKLKLEEIVAFTTRQNASSRRVMEKIGMHYDLRDDFEHPQIEPGHPWRSHVLYRISKFMRADFT